MFAGVNSTNVTSSVATVDNDCSSDIPEWKKILIMKKRAGNSPSVVDEYSRRNPDSSAGGVNIATRNGGCSNTCDNSPAGGSCNKFGRSVKVEQDYREISPPKKVTIGNINVELRSVKATPDGQQTFPECPKLEGHLNSEVNGQEFDNGGCEDLQYGPGIVDRLRAKFLNMGAKPKCKPVVRRFSSLENLPGSNAGPYRVNARRQNGFKSGVGNLYGYSGNVKKAQSMETLICTTPEQQIFASSRRPNARFVGGVKARILNKNISPISVLTDENDEPREKSPSPAASPRLFTKCVRRWDYNRSVSAPNINEDELPKPDTVKHVKKIFESPPLAGSEKSNHSGGARFRKIPGTTTTPTSTCNNGAILGSARPAVKKPDEEDCPDAKTSAKEFPDLCNVNIPSAKKEECKREEVDQCDDSKITTRGFSPLLDDNLSANGSGDTLLSHSSSYHEGLIYTPESILESEEEIVIPVFTNSKVTPEHLPLEEGNKHSELLSQGSQVGGFNQVEPLQDEDQVPHPPTSVSCIVDEGMVVAAADEESFPPKKGTSWQKAPPSTTSIVFDFRGKDVKPNISLSPAPFGCRPAKVSRSSLKKRSGSPPRSGAADPKDYAEEEDFRNGGDEDEEDWDEMDIGADLPALSGIQFVGENVKIGRGALLEKRNKKLTIQFDDGATSTFEYPSENTSPSPREETAPLTDVSFNPTAAMGSVANSRMGLSNYTPQVLSSKDFELGVSQSNHRPTSLPDKCEKVEDIPSIDVIIPANPEDTGGWSATETADILF